MKVGGTQCIRTNDGYVIPLDIINGLPYLIAFSICTWVSLPRPFNYRRFTLVKSPSIIYSAATIIFSDHDYIWSMWNILCISDHFVYCENILCISVYSIGILRIFRVTRNIPTYPGCAPLMEQLVWPPASDLPIQHVLAASWQQIDAVNVFHHQSLEGPPCEERCLWQSKRPPQWLLESNWCGLQPQICQFNMVYS